MILHMRVCIAVVAALAVGVAPAGGVAPTKRANLPQLARSFVKAGAPGAIV